MNIPHEHSQNTCGSGSGSDSLVLRSKVYSKAASLSPNFSIMLQSRTRAVDLHSCHLSSGMHCIEWVSMCTPATHAAAPPTSCRPCSIAATCKLSCSPKHAVSSHSRLQATCLVMMPLQQQFDSVICNQVICMYSKLLSFTRYMQT